MIRENANEEQLEDIKQALIDPNLGRSWDDDEAWASFRAAMG